MFKLLATTAIIAVAATSASAWDGAKEVISNLDTIYKSVDGQAHFDGLLDSTKGSGALDSLIAGTNAGVTHISLQVGEDPLLNPNRITVSVNQGKTMQEIMDLQSNLVNQVNYDLFVDDDLTTVEAGTGNYSAGFGIGEGAIDPVDGSTDYASSLSLGLVGAKVTKVVADVNALNNQLVSAGITTDAANAIANAIGNDATLNGLDGITGITLNADITGLNTATDTASSATGFFDGTSSVINGSNLANFQVPGYSVGGEINDGTKTYPTLLDWANDTNGVEN